MFLTNFHSLAVPGTYKMYLKRTEVMPSGLIPSCQIEGAKMETVTDFLFLSPKITADGYGSYEIKRDTGSLEEKL